MLAAAAAAGGQEAKNEAAGRATSSLWNSEKKIKVAFAMGRREMTKRDVIGRRKPSEAAPPRRWQMTKKEKKNLHKINPNSVKTTFTPHLIRSRQKSSGKV